MNSQIDRVSKVRQRRPIGLPSNMRTNTPAARLRAQLRGAYDEQLHRRRGGAKWVGDPRSVAHRQRCAQLTVGLRDQDRTGGHRRGVKLSEPCERDGVAGQRGTDRDRDIDGFGGP